MINKAGVSLITKGWNLIDLELDRKRIENPLIKKALGVTCDFEDAFTSVIEENIFQDYIGQEWIQGDTDNEGYFTLRSASTFQPYDIVSSNYLTGNLRQKSSTDNMLVPYLYLLHAGCGDEKRCRGGLFSSELSDY